jgi:hypothetical protein
MRAAISVAYVMLVSFASVRTGGPEGEQDMERKLVDVGHQVEPGPGLISDITHTAPGHGEAGRLTGADATSGEAPRSALKKVADAVSDGLQKGMAEIVAYTRREPAAALTAATGFGFFVGIAIGSRAGTRGTSARLPWLNARRSLLGGRAPGGWRGFLQRDS